MSETADDITDVRQQLSRLIIIATDSLVTQRLVVQRLGELSDRIDALCGRPLPPDRPRRLRP